MRLNSALAASLLLAVASGTALADDTVEVRRIGEGIGRTFTLHGTQVGGNFYTFQIGQLTHQFRNGVGEGAFLNGTMQTFCTDLVQDSSWDWELYRVVPLSQAPLPGPAMGASKAQAIADVWFGAAGLQFTSADHAAALQMAIWDIVYDYDGTIGSISATTGSVRFNNVPAGVQTAFTFLCGAIGNNSPIDGLRALSNPDFQDQIVIIPAPGAAAVLGLGGLLAVGRRRR